MANCVLPTLIPPAHSCGAHPSNITLLLTDFHTGCSTTFPSTYKPRENTIQMPSGDRRCSIIDAAWNSSPLWYASTPHFKVQFTCKLTRHLPPPRMHKLSHQCPLAVPARFHLSPGPPHGAAVLQCRTRATSRQSVARAPETMISQSRVPVRSPPH